MSFGSIVRSVLSVGTATVSVLLPGTPAAVIAQRIDNAVAAAEHAIPGDGMGAARLDHAQGVFAEEMGMEVAQAIFALRGETLGWDKTAEVEMMNARVAYFNALKKFADSVHTEKKVP